MTIKVKITREENAAHFKKEIGDVVTVPLEEYVAAVVASEIGNAHVEACKAQAVAARTFAYPYYSNGTTITDASSTHQAYRAPRFNEKAYPNAIRGACATSGQLLFYNGSVIGTCSYSASNGGRTVSSEERWGGKRPWLIAQDDPWDAAAGTGKNGHGVGMSQRGAKYAAGRGISYDAILAFYYPGTTISPAISIATSPAKTSTDNPRVEEMMETMKETEDKSMNILYTATVTTTGGTLNLRQTPKNGKVLARLAANSTVDVFEEQDGWMYVQQGEHVGWVSGEYLTKNTTVEEDEVLDTAEVCIVITDSEGNTFKPVGRFTVDMVVSTEDGEFPV